MFALTLLSYVASECSDGTIHGAICSAHETGLPLNYNCYGAVMARLQVGRGRTTPRPSPSQPPLPPEAEALRPEHHPKTKHIDRRHFYVRECVEDLKIRVPFVASHDNLADFFTKPLNAKNFFRLRDIIMNISHAT